MKKVSILIADLLVHIQLEKCCMSGELLDIELRQYLLLGLFMVLVSSILISFLFLWVYIC